jgi:hypothetical protein
MRLGLALVLVVLPPSVHRWRVGPAPRYTPPATTAAVAAGTRVGALTCGPIGRGYRIHLELFANRKVVIVPAGIGVSKTGCRYPVTTQGPDGIVRVAPGLRLADVFHVWGQTLEGHRLASFTSRSPLRAYVGGKLVRGSAGAIPLTPHAQIVLELGGYVPPHPFFLFAGGDS